MASDAKSKEMYWACRIDQGVCTAIMACMCGSAYASTVVRTVSGSIRRSETVSNAYVRYSQYIVSLQEFSVFSSSVAGCGSGRGGKCGRGGVLYSEGGRLG